MDKIMSITSYWFLGMSSIEHVTIPGSSIPPTARIQTGDPMVWTSDDQGRRLMPWSEACTQQLKEMGASALAYVGPSRHRPAPTPEKVLQAVALLRDLAEYDQPPISFKARRRPRLEQHRPRLEQHPGLRRPMAYKSGADND